MVKKTAPGSFHILQKRKLYKNANPLCRQKALGHIL